MDVKPLQPPAPTRAPAASQSDGRPPVAATAPQPFVYPLEREFREPDWTRIPGYRSVSRADWESALWQRRYEYFDPVYTLPESGQEWWRQQARA